MRAALLSATLLTILAFPVIASDNVAYTYNCTDTELGLMLDNPALKAIVEKHLPGLTNNDQVDMARGMSLKDIQMYSPDEITDEKLAAIDAEIAKLPKN
ncbi:MAG: hypothetical protein JKY66_04690 [Spongiibacteraceae bacterium]|nr:hypothetical protein [Spongiibacteraceae bacterium]MBN4055478.1 hypothetical protein [bacterium AH-315-K03]